MKTGTAIRYHAREDPSVTIDRRFKVYLQKPKVPNFVVDLCLILLQLHGADRELSRICLMVMNRRSFSSASDLLLIRALAPAPAQKLPSLPPINLVFEIF